MKSIKDFFETGRIRKQEQNYYFEETKDEIAQTNLSVLRNISAVSLLTAVFLIWLTPYIIPKWSVTGHYLPLFVALLLFLVLGQLAIRKGFKETKYIHLMCMCFEVLVFLSLIWIDVFAYPQWGATFFPMALIVLPVVFIFPMAWTCVVMIGAETLFLLSTLVYKQHDIASSDFFDGLLGLIFGLFLMAIMMQLRVKDNMAKIAYKRRSMTDLLTGILNKTACEECIHWYLRTRPLEENCALLVIDIDDFKLVNDQFGHQAGDRLLEELGHTLTCLFRSNDVIGRIGGDEFMVLMKNITDEAFVENKCKEIQKMLEVVLFEGVELSVSCSIGAVMVDGGGTVLQEMFSMADAAMYEAKTNGKAHHVLRRL